MKRANKEHPWKWQKRFLIPYWILQIGWMCILIGTSGWLTSQQVIASEVVIILICSFCLCLTTAEMVQYIQRNLRPKLYLILQIIKTKVWLVIFLITVLDNTILAYPDGDQPVISTVNTDGQLVGSNVNVAIANAPTVLLNGVLESSVVLVTLIAALIYASVNYHRDRQIRRNLRLQPALQRGIDFPSDDPNSLKPRRGRVSLLRQALPGSRALSSHELEAVHGTTSPSPFQTAPLSECGLFSSLNPRNAWQQDSCPSQGTQDNNNTIPQTAHVQNPTIHEIADADNPTSPASTVAMTHMTRTTNTTASNSSRRTRIGPPPSYRSTEASGRSPSIPPSSSPAPTLPPYAYAPSPTRRSSLRASQRQRRSLAGPQGQRFSIGAVMEKAGLSERRSTPPPAGHPALSSRAGGPGRGATPGPYELRADRSVKSARSISARTDAGSSSDGNGNGIGTERREWPPERIHSLD